jgi:hypothetical protein
MSFVIQIVPGRAAGEALVLDVLGLACGAARGDLGAEIAIKIRGTPLTPTFRQVDRDLPAGPEGAERT